ncbi:MAG TPA: P-II family nitrogen regulator [Nitrososphaera sp.]|nr:P-II family nitrogen regulator [Nitrososphaera sp.]
MTIFIRAEDLPKVTEILQKHKVGITFFEIHGTGRTPRAAREVVQSYMTGRSSVPEFVKRYEVKSIVPESSKEEIVDDLLNSFSPSSEPYGVVFIKDVSDAYELGTKLRGNQVLALK